MNFLHILLKCHQRKLISSCQNAQYYFERPPTSQNIEYKVVVFKSGKSNANADILSQQRGVPAIESLTTDFLDEFRDSPFPEFVFHVEGEEVSEFQEIITYLTERRYPEGLNREEKSMFESKVAPYSLIQGTLLEDAWSRETRKEL